MGRKIQVFIHPVWKTNKQQQTLKHPGPWVMKAQGVKPSPGHVNMPGIWIWFFFIFWVRAATHLERAANSGMAALQSRQAGRWCRLRQEESLSGPQRFCSDNPRSRIRGCKTCMSSSWRREEGSLSQPDTSYIMLIGGLATSGCHQLARYLVAISQRRSPSAPPTHNTPLRLLCDFAETVNFFFFCIPFYFPAKAQMNVLMYAP